MNKITDWLKSILTPLPEEQRVKGLWPLEWAMLAYGLFTLVLMAILNTRLVNPGPMLVERAGALVLLLMVWSLYRLYPCWWNTFVRICLVMCTLSRWYPDTYEFNRLFTNLDHVFAQADQTLFGCQPALWFSKTCPWTWFSEPLCLGYVSYFPLMTLLVLWIWSAKPQSLLRCTFVVMASFFIYYVIFIFLPVAGPQYYYQAEGVDAAQGIFPQLGHYFYNHSEMFPPAGSGFFQDAVTMAHEAGERPTAAFPSSHIGVTAILLIIAWRENLKRLFFIILPLFVLMTLATVYIHAHYVVDGIAGILSAPVIYCISSKIYQKIWGQQKNH